MKKIVSFMVVAIVALCAMVLTSCNSNKSNSVSNGNGGGNEYSESPLIGDFVLLSSVNADGTTVTGLKKGDKVVIEPQFREITYDAVNGTFECLVSDDGAHRKFTLADADGHIMRPGEYEKFTKDEYGYYHLFNDEGEAIYSPSAKKSLGMYEKISIGGPKHEFLFCKKDGKWGVSTFGDIFYLEKMYDRVYIVNYKNDKSFVVITQKGDEWEMYEQTDKEKLYYDVTAAEIRKLTKDRESGFLDVKF